MSDVVQPPISLDGLIQDSIRNSLTSDKIAKQVQAAADKAVSDAINSAFDYSSPFRKSVEAAIKQVLPVVNVDDLADFANATREVIQRRLSTLASDTAKEHLDGILADLFPNAPVITMEELRQEYFEKVRKDERVEHGCDCHDDDDEEPEVTWDIQTSTSSRGYWDLTIAPKPDSSRYGKDVVNLRFRDKDGGLSECWMVSVGKNAEAIGSIFHGPLYGFDAMVFRLATGTAKLQKQPAEVSV